MDADADRLHAALCRVWEHLCSVLPGARFERRDGYLWTVCPAVPIAQFNGVWPVDDAFAGALEGALHEVAELGLPYSMQARAGKTPGFEQEAERLGLLVESELPGMLVEAGELVDAHAPELQLIRVRTADGFGAPAELLAPLYAPEVAELEGLAIYIGRVGEVDVTTGVGFTVDDAVGVFTIATPPAHRGRGYGAAVTAHAALEGFAAGARFAFLQSSDSGYAVYRRLGFRDVERYLLYTAPEAPGMELTG